MKLVSVTEMKALEESANAAGYSFAQMMDHAGKGIAQIVDDRYRKPGENRALGLVGGGNNGGDTLVALSDLIKRGWIAVAILFKDRARTDELLSEYIQSGGMVEDISVLEKENLACDVILDGVYGTGFRKPIPEKIEESLRKINQRISNQKIVAVDCPSGVDCETGEVSPATIKADLTVCLEAVKHGMVKLPAFEFCGELVTIDLAISRNAEKSILPENQVVDADTIKKLLPIRSAFSHKGTFGKLMVVGGSVNYTGAPILAGKAAYAVGAGLVQEAVPEMVYQAAAGSNLELTWLILDEEQGVIAESASELVFDQIPKADCIVIGPGIGREATTKRFLERILFHTGKRATGYGFIPGQRGQEIPNKEKSPILVVDADALTLLAEFPDWFQKITVPMVITPHPGEMARLTGLTVEEIQRERFLTAAKYAAMWRKTVVLKGALTVVAGEDGSISIIPIATSALAKAGTGDVLAGMIGGFMAQGVAPYDAAVVGCWVHGQAGVQAAKTLGHEASVLASQLIDSVPNILGELIK